MFHCSYLFYKNPKLVEGTYNITNKVRIVAEEDIYKGYRGSAKNKLNTPIFLSFMVRGKLINAR